MQIITLASSSSGNCHILRSQSGTLILDAGVSLRTIKTRLNFLLTDVKGCLLTHIHNDHSKAVSDLLRFSVPCYMSKCTAESLYSDGQRFRQIECVTAYEQFNIGGFKIIPVELQHDVENYGYLIYDTAERIKAVYVTDTFYCSSVFKAVNVYIVECNYIRDTMMANYTSGNIQEAYMQRLLKSHFELDNVIKFLKASDLSVCSKIILVHLSDRNSDAERMVREVEAATGVQATAAEAGTEVEISRDPY